MCFRVEVNYLRSRIICDIRFSTPIFTSTQSENEVENSRGNNQVSPE